MNKEEMRYLELRARFENELSEVSAKIDALGERRVHLEAVLNGTAKIEEPAEVEVEPEITVNKEKIDKTILRFIKKNPGSSRSTIAGSLSGYSDGEINRAIERLRKRGLTQSSGRGRASVWYVVENES